MCQNPDAEEDIGSDYRRLKTLLFPLRQMKVVKHRKLLVLTVFACTDDGLLAPLTKGKKGKS